MTENTNKELYTALSKAQGEFAEIKKSEIGQIGNQKFRYADLDQLIKATRPALTKHNLSVIQLLETEGGENFVTTTLAHSSGQSVSSKLLVERSQCVRVQDYGKTSSYLRRYGYSAILCLAADADLDSPDEGEQGFSSRNEPQQFDTTKHERRESTALPAYPKEMFDKNFEARAEGVRNGQTTPDQIIAMLASKYTLSDWQRETLLKLSEQYA